MNKERLFEHLRKQEPEKLIEILDTAFDTLNTNQRHDVFGCITTDISPTRVDAEKLLSDIEGFKKRSLTGHYYAPFDIKEFFTYPRRNRRVV